MTRILYGYAARSALVRGIDRMAALVAPTLGPAARTVAVDSLVSNTPEVLDSGALIARRTIQFADPFEDMGGMLLRHLLMTVLERSGDGTATTAVLARALVDRLHRYLTADEAANVRALERGLDCAARVGVEALEQQARPIEGAHAVASVAEAVVRDASIATIIGDIFEAAGPEAAVVVESGDSVTTTFEYVEGVRWNEGLVSEAFADSGQAGVRLIEPRILTTDGELDKPEQVASVLEACQATGARDLLVIAPEVRDPVIGLLVLNRQRGILDRVAAVRAPFTGDVQAAILADIAALTGGRFVRAAADGLSGFCASDLGHARQAWATRTAFGLLGGHGSRSAIRDRLASARADLRRAADDHHLRNAALQRIGRLLGIGAVIRVGAASDLAREELRSRAESAVTAARLALEEGVVPGGGAALVGCAQSIRCARFSTDVAIAPSVLAESLLAPMRTIAHNAGCADPAYIVHQARRRAPNVAFDVVHGRWVDPYPAGLLDPLPITRTAFEVSVSLARLVVTTGALVRRRQVAPPAGR